MNIFYTSDDPVQAARDLCDQHVNKMIVESAQMMSTAIRRHAPELNYGIIKIYKPAYQRHPCTIWAGDSREHFLWLHSHATAIYLEFRKRYKNDHKTGRMLPLLKACDFLVPSIGFSEPPMCMGDQFKTNCTVTSYQKFITHDKPFATWNRGTAKPSWYKKV